MVHLTQQMRIRGKPDHATIAEATALGEAWDKWWLANGKDVFIPPDVPD